LRGRRVPEGPLPKNRLPPPPRARLLLGRSSGASGTTTAVGGTTGPPPGPDPDRPPHPHPAFHRTVPRDRPSRPRGLRGGGMGAAVGQGRGGPARLRTRDAPGRPPRRATRRVFPISHSRMGPPRNRPVSPIPLTAGAVVC